MEEIKQKLTDDAVTERLLAQLGGGYTAPELARDWLIYIKLNQLENKLEPEQPAHKTSPNTGKYICCPMCGRETDHVLKPRYCYNCGKALKWIEPPQGRFA
jgi:hypothetical protein